ncbi:uncharacterized protein EV422DRAFT_368963 [Fimicolochytrium jonesii]|uniref:uncharacterized protein n=1 Tax=Fimicolochytrium jonesii TaxID=1396493 RepID=UPI0022FE83B9|nr:uncharacterized protein EV422DRAFT_368963 [Fimicolochytrium jonesii]KAI8823763.1 hypothetical protein EV422DRAFT_368963 [Fimicolochytrium jonesii]
MLDAPSQAAESVPLLGGSSTNAQTNAPQPSSKLTARINRAITIGTFIFVLAAVITTLAHFKRDHPHQPLPLRESPYGKFPKADDPFAFMPCTNVTLPPALDDQDPLTTWSKLFDPEPSHWSWGRLTGDDVAGNDKDSHEGRGIYLCGYLDVPLDYTNSSDERIARLMVTKFQVSGLARKDAAATEDGAGKKSARTIVMNPGGPGGSGSSLVWNKAENFTRLYSDSKFDVLSWDPRGVNSSLPSASCFPHEAERDRWLLLTNQYYESASSHPRAQLELADAMNEATFRACHARLGDFPRFVSTAFVARDVDEIRKALGEEELTAVMISYGTGIGQTYANMFPDRVGRMLLDGTEYVKDHRLLGGFGWTALDNATDAWRDGFLGECINAGPSHCALAKSTKPVTLSSLTSRMSQLFNKTLQRPVPAYHPTTGPGLITYPSLIGMLYQSLYNPAEWPTTAQMLADLEQGNGTLALLELNKHFVDPLSPPVPRLPATEELGSLVICADSYDAPEPPTGLDWYLDLWRTMTTKSFISGNSRFFDVLPCRHFNTHWKPAEVYRGDLNTTLKGPVLLVAETYDPATPLRNGRRLAGEMGRNARLVVHHGYGHSAPRDPSACTARIGKEYILHGKVPEADETDCYADSKPYLPK